MPSAPFDSPLSSAARAEQLGHRFSAPAQTESAAPAQLRARSQTGASADQGGAVVQREEAAAPAAPRNDTGMPDNLKAGIESLSGMDLSGVRVHKNSSRPGRVDALAYTQGNEIHLAPGQEHHLAHEAWHVVQQRQGRVRVTTRVAGKGVNDEHHLEREADHMGSRALQMMASPARAKPRARPVATTTSSPGQAPIQGVWTSDHLGRMYRDGQRVKDYAVPTTAAGNIVLGIKNPNSPYRDRSGRYPRAFMGGLPSLPGGNFESRHTDASGRLDTTGMATVDSEMDEELLRRYRRTGAETFAHEVDDGNAYYRFHHVPAESILHPRALPARHGNEAYYENSTTMELNPSAISDHTLDDAGIQDQILAQAGINPVHADRDSLNEFRGSHVTTHLVSTIRSRNHAARQREVDNRRTDVTNRQRDIDQRQPRVAELENQLAPLRAAQQARDAAAQLARQHDQTANTEQGNHAALTFVGQHQDASNALFRSFTAMQEAHRQRAIAQEQHQAATALEERMRPQLAELTQHRDAVAAHRTTITQHQARLGELNTIMTAHGYRTS